MIDRLERIIESTVREASSAPVALALGRSPKVRSAIAAVAGDRSENRRLVAYVLPEPGESLDTDELRAFAGRRLPAYMVPAAFIVIDRLPLSPNGKIDRAALPKFSEAKSAPAIVPATSLMRLAEKVAQLLHVDRIDPDDDLPALGLNSVDMMRLANELEKTFGFRPKMADLFRLTSVSAIADFYEKHEAARTQKPAKASPRLLIDPAEREAFKKSAPSLRRFSPGAAVIPLVKLPQAAPLRGSARTFRQEALPEKNFSGFLTSLRSIEHGGGVRYNYGSA